MIAEKSSEVSSRIDDHSNRHKASCFVVSVKNEVISENQNPVLFIVTAAGGEILGDVHADCKPLTQFSAAVGLLVEMDSRIPSRSDLACSNQTTSAAIARP